MITKMEIKNVKQMKDILNWGLTRQDVNQTLKELQDQFNLESNQIKNLKQIINYKNVVSDSGWYRF